MECIIESNSERLITLIRIKTHKVTLNYKLTQNILILIIKTHNVSETINYKYG